MIAFIQYSLSEIKEMAMHQEDEFAVYMYVYIKLYFQFMNVYVLLHACLMWGIVVGILNGVIMSGGCSGRLIPCNFTHFYSD